MTRLVLGTCMTSMRQDIKTIDLFQHRSRELLRELFLSSEASTSRDRAVSACAATGKSTYPLYCRGAFGPHFTFDFLSYSPTTAPKAEVVASDFNGSTRHPELATPWAEKP
ncbi:hypothetical protein LTS16_000069 [Friedmanniomyces endolithicus]|uniref:Uncharacterized protein n=1 Tax=Friedmanniomyces endolithicus TaxID=329885 RepID=A0AAN6FBR8_9PEZI|nr:hypothetical protein LTS09_001166 [Friedmanniomyces endolithicus]KAK0292052.1 hypothetical protein LTR35_001481 [Friedmanniomyces endolithicus]KAK0297966.1 hypothetical protein LTS00_003505 [Friedmanniomyces endolithicus]KAK0310056.1 hypothetical protein LTR01_004255 [Friedmanniomyces endolithicus]KAK0310791.1 hypothetical protein LTR82_014677 [Friedmanniomyces endolithicus]